MQFNRTTTGSAAVRRVLGSVTLKNQAKLEGDVCGLISVESDGFSSEPNQLKGRCVGVSRNHYRMLKHNKSCLNICPLTSYSYPVSIYCLVRYVVATYTPILVQCTLPVCCLLWYVSICRSQMPAHPRGAIFEAGSVCSVGWM